MALPVQTYLDIRDAFELLQTMGVVRTERQVRAAAERGKLPFFKDPVTNRRIIAKEALIEVYLRRQNEALRNMK